MVFGRKKKNQTKTFKDGEEVPDSIPDLEVPTPPKEEIKPLNAEDVYAEGRSVGFQEGMIYSLNIVQEHLVKHQDELRKKLKEKE